MAVTYVIIALSTKKPYKRNKIDMQDAEPINYNVM